MPGPDTLHKHAGFTMQHIFVRRLMILIALIALIAVLFFAMRG